MRILFFSNIPIDKGNVYNGGGWIYSLIDEMKKVPGMTIAIASCGATDFKGKSDGLIYYQIKSLSKNNIIIRGIQNISILFGNYEKKEEKEWIYYKERLRSIVDDFEPNVIQVFGSEQQFGLISCVTRIPVILHIQGLLNPCYNALLPPFFSWNNIINWLRPIRTIKILVRRKKYEIGAFREREILKNVNYFLGRTSFDKVVTRCFSPSSKYYYCSEILRNVFYEKNNRHIPQKLKIISTISHPYYKGYDNILKTAYVLKNYVNIDFEWFVYGNVKPNIIEKIVGINHVDVCIHLQGVVNANILKNEILASTCYFHPSHIDNSPNGLCEAQILGVPVLACNVGGVSSLVDNGSTGFLIPDNDPYQASYVIKLLYEDLSLNEMIGYNSKIVANKRHEKTSIVNDLINIYNEIKT